MKNTLPLISQRKAQMHMTETVAVLFIFFILVAFGITFYYNYQHSALTEEQVKIVENKLEKVTSRVLSLPELSCTRGEAETDGDCFDLVNLGHAQELFSQHFSDYYCGLFSYAKITVTELYPGNSTWTIYDQRKNTSAGEHLSYDAAFFVVSLRNQTASLEETHFGLGKLEVGVYYEPIQ